MIKLLVIEDELFVRESITELLEAEDYEVFSTENGILGILWAQENLPDLIICDVMMPEMDGRDVLDEISKLPTLAWTPFIFLTAKADKLSVREGMELGADDYLTKPITRDELVNAIETRLAKQQKISEQYDREHQRAEQLEQKVRELEELYEQERFPRKYYEAILRLVTAIDLVGKIPLGELRDRNIENVRQSYEEEIEMINQEPSLRKHLLSENLDISSLMLDS